MVPGDLEDGGEVRLQRSGVRREFTQRLWVRFDVFEPARLHLQGREPCRRYPFGQRWPRVLCSPGAGTAILFRHVE